MREEGGGGRWMRGRGEVDEGGRGRWMRGELDEGRGGWVGGG